MEFYALRQVRLAVNQRDRLREVQINLSRERVEESKGLAKPSLASSAAGIERSARRACRNIRINEPLVDEIGC